MSSDEQTTTWYHVPAYGDDIYAVEVTAYTDRAVTVAGRNRTRRGTGWGDFFPDWFQARDFAQERADREFKQAQEAVKEAGERLRRLALMQPPAGVVAALVAPPAAE